MEWPNDLVLEFIDLYEQEPIIWNSSLPSHKNRNVVFDAWKRIEFKMGGKFSVTELKKKKDSLMASFRSCLKKVKDSDRSGAGSQDVHKPSWFAYDKMERFLRDRVKPRETLCSEEQIEKENDPDLLETLSNEDQHQGSEAIVLPMSYSPSPKPPPRKKVKAMEREMHRKIEGAYEAIQEKLASSKERGLCDIYGELVAAKLKTMDCDTRGICMHRIDNIIFEMQRSKTSSSTTDNDIIIQHVNENVNENVVAETVMVCSEAGSCQNSDTCTYYLTKFD